VAEPHELGDDETAATVLGGRVVYERDRVRAERARRLAGMIGTDDHTHDKDSATGCCRERPTRSAAAVAEPARRGGT
jgi:hypothetical protein